MIDLLLTGIILDTARNISNEALAAVTAITVLDIVCGGALRKSGKTHAQRFNKWLHNRRK